MSSAAGLTSLHTEYFSPKMALHLVIFLGYFALLIFLNLGIAGQVFENIGKDFDLYPSVGLQHLGENIHANFGQEPFKYDIDYHVQQQYNVTWNNIQNTHLDSTVLRGHYRRTGLGSIASITEETGVKASLTEDESKEVLNQLVMSYLVHHGYAKTARAFEIQKPGRNQEIAHLPAETDVDMNSSTTKLDALDSDILSRTSIVNSVLAGDINSAIDMVQKQYPTVLEADDHLVLFKLRCRKFVELILETTEMKRKMKRIREREMERPTNMDSAQDVWMEEEMNMDIDEDAPGTLHVELPASSRPSGITHGSEPDPQAPVSADRFALQYETALNAAILYGQSLSSDYQSDPRPELQRLFKNTFGIVAWEDPLEAGAPIADLVGHESRVALAHELNQAILSRCSLNDFSGLRTYVLLKNRRDDRHNRH